MIGRPEKTVIDCPDPHALAGFYAAVFGMFQRVDKWVPPPWPDPDHPQQLHLDIRVDDIEEAERSVLALGAKRVPAVPESGFRVFVDPAGHPFCLVFG